MLNLLENYFKKEFDSKELFYIIRSNKPLLSFIKENTSFLPNTATVVERFYCLKYTINEIKTCKMCNNPVKFKNLKDGYSTFCSVSCLNKSDIHKEKVKQTHLKNTGTTTHLNSKEITEKRKKNNLEKWGSEHNFSSLAFKEFRNDLFETKYGNKNISQTEYFKMKMYQKSFETLSKRLSFFDIEIIDKEFSGLVNGEFTFSKLNRFQNRIFFHLKCKKCNHEYKNHLLDGFIPLCPKCNNLTKSKPELYLKMYLDELELNYSLNDRKIIKPFELDFYFEDFNFAIELNGVYFHSIHKLSQRNLNETLFTHYGLDNNVKNYHLLKTKMCEEKLINLIQFYDLEWNHPEKKEIIKSMIRYHLKKVEKNINARKCVIKTVSNSDTTQFLDKNHIQGSVKSKHNLGLYFNNELVSLMTFSKSRYENKDTFELIRFCNLINVNVRGAASKLLHYFQNTINLLKNDIVSYADRRYSNGNLYKTLNFDYIHTTKPNYKYLKNGKLFHRQLFQKKLLKYYYENNKYDIKLFDETLSEQDIMVLCGYHIVYEVGQMKFLLKH